MIGSWWSRLWRIAVQIEEETENAGIAKKTVESEEDEAHHQMTNATNAVASDTGKKHHHTNSTSFIIIFTDTRKTGQHAYRRGRKKLRFTQYVGSRNEKRMDNIQKLLLQRQMRRLMKSGRKLYTGDKESKRLFAILLHICCCCLICCLQSIFV